MNIEEIKQRIEELHGYVIAQRLALQVILAHHPEALRTLRSIDPNAYRDLSMFRPLPDESIRAAVAHLALLQNPLD